MTRSKVIGWFLLILGTPVCLGILIFVTGASIWGIIWESEPAITFDMKVALAAFVIIALSLTITTVWKGYSLIRLNKNGVSSRIIGWLLLIIGATGILGSTVGIVAVHPYYSVMFLVSCVATIIGWSIVYPQFWSSFRFYIGWFFFITTAGAMIYGIFVVTGEFLDWGISVGVGNKYDFYYSIMSCVLFPWIIITDAWWLRLVLKRRSAQLTTRLAEESDDVSGE